MTGQCAECGSVDSTVGYGTNSCFNCGHEYYIRTDREILLSNEAMLQRLLELRLEGGL
jgi:hypothetical protein